MKYALVANVFPNTVEMYLQSQKEISRLSILKPEDRIAAKNKLSQEGQPYMISGIFNWCVIHGGDFLFAVDLDKETLEQYDYVHVNVHRGTWESIKQVRDIIGPNSHTKIIANLDYSLDLWAIDDKISRVPSLLEYFDMADIVFSVEKIQQQFLSFVLKRPVHYLPHPANVDGMRTWVNNGRVYKPLSERTVLNGKPSAVCTLHRWTSQAQVQDYLTPLFAFKPSWKTDGSKLPPLPCAPILTGVMPESVRDAQALWGRVYKQGMLPISFHTLLSNARAVYNYYSMHSMDRIGIECAALGTPVVGSYRSEALARCFPELVTDHQDLKRTYDLMQTLLTDASFWEKQIAYASEAVSFYNYEVSKKRFNEMLIYT
jgi:hypothetical protein